MLAPRHRYIIEPPASGALARACDLRTMETPCTNVCELDAASGVCLGCGRSLAEIAGWATMTSAERRRVMGELATRKFARKEAMR